MHNINMVIPNKTHYNVHHKNHIISHHRHHGLNHRVHHILHNRLQNKLQNRLHSKLHKGSTIGGATTLTNFKIEPKESLFLSWTPTTLGRQSCIFVPSVFSVPEIILASCYDLKLDISWSTLQFEQKKKQFIILHISNKHKSWLFHQNLIK